MARPAMADDAWRSRLNDAVRRREAQLSRDRRCVVWLLLPVSGVALSGLWPAPVMAVPSIAYAVAVVGPVAYLAARFYNTIAVRRICTTPALPSHPHRLLLAAPPLGLGILWGIATTRFYSPRLPLSADDLGRDWLLPLAVVLVMLVSSALSHWLESHDWRSRARTMLIQGCGLDPTALMGSEAYRWTCWWGWRELGPMPEVRQADGLAGPLSRIALALAVPGIVGLAPMIVLSGRHPDWLAAALAVSLGLSGCAFLLGAAGLLLAWMWPSASARRASVLAVVLALPPLVYVLCTFE